MSQRKTFKSVRMAHILCGICILFSYFINGFSQPPNTPLPPVKCDVWSYVWSSSPETLPNGTVFQWEDWHANTFPDDCNVFNGTLGCYWKDAKSACEAWVKETEQAGINYDLPSKERPYTASSAPTNFHQNIYSCSYKKKNGTRLIYLGVVDTYRKDIPDYCYVTLEGPYRNCSDTHYYPNNTKNKWFFFGRRGADFATNPQKKLIRELNAARNRGQLRSDLLNKTIFGLKETCDPLLDPTLPRNQNDPCVAQVAHILPQREDTLNCPCGTNSYKNALLVSKQMNDKMKSHPPPQELIDVLAEAKPYTDTGQCKPHSPTASLLIPEYFGWPFLLGD